VQRRRKLIDVVIWLLAASTAGLFVLFVLVLTGVVVDDDAGSGPPAGTVPTTTAPGTVTIRPEPPPTETTAAEPAPELARVTITATRGACWVQAKVGSEDGRTLAERVLLEGESVTMRARSVWLTLGASANVDVTVNGRLRRLGFGTVAVVLTARPQA
jgi:hypothetical protein